MNRRKFFLEFLDFNRINQLFKSAFFKRSYVIDSTCFMGDEHSDQQIGRGCLPLVSSSEVPVDDVEPGNSWPRCSFFLPATRPSQCRLRIWKIGSACNLDSCADQGRVRWCRPIFDSLKTFRKTIRIKKKDSKCIKNTLCTIQQIPKKDFQIIAKVGRHPSTQEQAS